MRGMILQHTIKCNRGGYKNVHGCVKIPVHFLSEKGRGFLFTNQWVPSQCRNSENAHNFIFGAGGAFLHAWIDLGLELFIS